MNHAKIAVAANTLNFARMDLKKRENLSKHRSLSRAAAELELLVNGRENKNNCIFKTVLRRRLWMDVVMDPPCNIQVYSSVSKLNKSILNPSNWSKEQLNPLHRRLPWPKMEALQYSDNFWIF